jgi:RNA-directed DNA polymerase
MTAQRNGKVRQLALPTVRDRVAQRAFLEVVGRKLDVQAAEASFAYRKGRSWLDALARAERSRDQGLRFVMRADIEKFFDRIDHAILARTLASSIGDPRAVDLALSWSAAPTLGANGIEPRPCGVPQGAPVSPALANAYLVDFDRAMEDKRGRLVRYADDIAVFCADLDSAEVARLDAETALLPLRLRLNAAKTYVSSFDRGFSFLGWVFFRDSGHEEMPGDTWIHPMSVGRPSNGIRQAQGSRPSGRSAASRRGWA